MSTTSSPSSSGGDDEWDDWNSEAGAPGSGGDDDAARSLFDATVLPSVGAALAHDAAEHGFDLAAFRKNVCVCCAGSREGRRGWAKGDNQTPPNNTHSHTHIPSLHQLRLDDHDTFRVINYVRSEVAAGRDPRPQLTAAAASADSGDPHTPHPWSGDAYLVPVLPDDALMFYEFDEEDGGGGVSGAAGASAPDDPSTLAHLRADNDRLRAALAALAAAILPPDAAGALPPGLAAALAEQGWGGGEERGQASSDPLPPPSAAVAAADVAYFDSYSGLGIHREMLSDDPRTCAYRDALEKNPSLLKDATVLDVGCGTGVLSLFAARGGASRVIGVDGSATMAALAREIVAANGLDAESGGPVSIVAGRVETLTSLPGLPPGAKVDAIVSEWMGYALFFECMLDAVFAARDAWLKPGGAMLPDRTFVSIAGVTSSASDLDFWADVHGLTMAPAAAAVKRARRAHGAVVSVPPDAVVTTSAAVHALDLCTASVDDIPFSTPFEVAVLPAVTAAGASLGAIAVWFDVEFSERACRDHPVLLSTSPTAPPTHWHQALLELDASIPLSGPDGAAVVVGRVSLAPAPSHRGVDISLELTARSADGAVVGQQTGLYPFVMSGGG